MPYRDPQVRAQKTKERLRRLRAKNPGYSTAKNRKWQAENPEKRTAHKAVENALNVGGLIKGPCEVCGEGVVEAHHDDYALPLSVRWLCHVHHVFLHSSE